MGSHSRKLPRFMFGTFNKKSNNNNSKNNSRTSVKINFKSLYEIIFLLMNTLE